MSEATYNPLVAGLEEIRASWGWFLVLGILLAIFGVLCVAFDVSATSATVSIFGWMLLISGVFALVHAFDLIFDGVAIIGFATAINSLPGRTAYGTT